MHEHLAMLTNLTSSTFPLNSFSFPAIAEVLALSNDTQEFCKEGQQVLYTV